MILIVPDIHGRKFWKEPCSNVDKYEKIIFLGDYLDPYTWREDISKDDAIDNFKEIISFARENKDSRKKQTLEEVIHGDIDLKYL